MAKALIVYGSTTGNTEMAARMISEILEEEGILVTVKNVADATVAELGNDYDITLLGVSTWGEDEIEFQEDFEPFFEKMDSAKLQGKKVALFGCGDSSYEHFCGAVDELESKMEELEADMVTISLRIDGDVDDAANEIKDWAKTIAESVG